ncbi:MAG: hypothetical protein JXR40_02280 [Pontiellaceae bacterium]|nr:hypothetical protein [Pontiellaceae bacterium]
MKKNIALLGTVCLLLTGCVSRTVSSDPSISDMNGGVGYNSDDKVVKKDIVWIWQAGFWGE